MVLDLHHLRQNDDIGGLLFLYFEMNVPGALTLLFELLTVNVDGLLLRPGSFDLEDLPLFEFTKKRRLRWRRRDKQKADGNVGQMTYGHGGFLAPNWLASKHRFAMLKGKVLRS